MIYDQETYDMFIQLARDLERLERKQIHARHCCKTCPGWAVFDTTREPLEEIEKCDDCHHEQGVTAKFVSDTEAEEYVLKKVFPNIDCGNDDCLLCRKRLAGFCDCGGCEHCNV